MGKVINYTPYFDPGKRGGHTSLGLKTNHLDFKCLQNYYQGPLSKNL